MAITLPVGIRVVAGLVGTTFDRLVKLPEDLPGIGVTVVGQLLRTSMRVRQEIAELATRGDELLSGITGGAEEHPLWATFDEDESPPVERSAPATSGRNRVRPDPTGADATRPDPIGPDLIRPDPSGSDGADHGAAPRRTARRVAPTTKPRTPIVTPTSGQAAPAGSPPARAPRTRRAAARPAGPADPTDLAGPPEPKPSTNQAGAAGRTTTGRTGPADPSTHPSPPDPRAPIEPDHGLTVAELKDRLPALSAPDVQRLLVQEETGPNRAAFLTLLANRLTTLQHER